MATDLQQVITFDDFSKGEWSTYGGMKPQPGMFTANNMLVRANGLIGPRAGLKNITPTGMPNGSLLALRAGPTPGRDGIFIIGHGVYYFDLFETGTAPTGMGTLGVVPTAVLNLYLATTKFYVAVPGDKTYVIDPIAGTTTGLTGSPGGHAVIQYGARLLVAQSTSSNRFFISDPQNFNSWPAENFIDVGDDWQITGFFVQKNHLTIMKREGIYVLTGTPTISEVIRLADTMQGPLQPWQAAIDQDDIIHLVSAFKLNPATFDGADGQQVAYLRELYNTRDDTDPAPPTKRGVETLDGGVTSSSVAVANWSGVGVGRLLVKHNNVWTKHSTRFDVSGMMTNSNGQLVLTDGGGPSSVAQIYTTRFDLERPAFVSDGLASVGDDSDIPVDASLTLPEWYAPDGYEVCVASVLVDIVKYDTGVTTADNGFYTTVYSIGGYQRPGRAATSGQDWYEAPSAATTDGVEERVQFNFEQIRGAGFQVVLNYITGVDIRAIQVVIQLQPNLPRI